MFHHLRSNAIYPFLCVYYINICHLSDTVGHLSTIQDTSLSLSFNWYCLFSSTSPMLCGSAWRRDTQYRNSCLLIDHSYNDHLLYNCSDSIHTRCDMLLDNLKDKMYRAACKLCQEHYEAKVTVHVVTSTCRHTYIHTDHSLIIKVYRTSTIIDKHNITNNCKLMVQA